MSPNPPGFQFHSSLPLPPKQPTNKLAQKSMNEKGPKKRWAGWAHQLPATDGANHSTQSRNTPTSSPSPPPPTLFVHSNSSSFRQPHSHPVHPPHPASTYSPASPPQTHHPRPPPATHCIRGTLARQWLPRRLYPRCIARSCSSSASRAGDASRICTRRGGQGSRARRWNGLLRSTIRDKIKQNIIASAN